MRGNKKKGTSAESRYLYNNWLYYHSGTRFYASVGLFDIIFIDKKYVTHLAQIKFSSVQGKKPYIHPKEILDIQIYVDQMGLKGIANIWCGYVLLPYRQSPIEVRMN